MTNTQSNPNEPNQKQFDLIDRTTNFAIKIISFVKRIPLNPYTRPIIDQLIRSGTSIGANYAEADETNSRRDFINKISIAKKETKETRYWLQLIISTPGLVKAEAEDLQREARELNLIFGAIIRNSKS